MTFERNGELIVANLGESQLVVDTRHGVPLIAHLGRPVDHADLTDWDPLRDRPTANAALDVEAAALIVPEQGSGWQGRPGLLGRRDDGSAWAPRFRPMDVVYGDGSVRVTACDDRAGLELATEIEVMPASARVRLELTNMVGGPFELDELTMAIPLPDRAAELAHLIGRWAHEFQVERLAWPIGEVSFDNRRGRTSHDRVPALFAGTPGFSENAGSVWAFVLGWSGNAICGAELLTDGRRLVRLGELLAPGDVVLGPGETYRSPWLEVAASDRGTNGVSQAFHESVRAQPVAPTVDRPRPVLLNTWEAVYFDHDLATLTALADRAARIGIERFVLDDGWFHGRRSDDAGLGDWWIDQTVWPDGLDPLIDHVRALDMEFGIWVEPEMVNPNSDLYRAHPDWVLGVEGYEVVTGRRQLVLNLSKPDVREYLIAQLDALFAGHEISYVKWDMNRDLVHSADGTRAAMHSHMHGVYALIDELRRRHPGVEIESCASGGARADFEILKRTERIWTSDSNDALERQRIQRGFSMLFPPEVMGAHIGPPRSHTSGRTHTLGFRAATAFFGHLGVEWNLLRVSDDELEELAAVIALHKEHRRLLHGGVVWRLDVADPNAVAHVVVAPDRSEAMLSYAQLDLPSGSVPPRVSVIGLDEARDYRIELLPVAGAVGPAPSQPAWTEDGASMSGRALGVLGIQPPLLHPESAIVVHLKAI